MIINKEINKNSEIKPFPKGKIFVSSFFSTYRSFQTINTGKIPNSAMVPTPPASLSEYTKMLGFEIEKTDGGTTVHSA